MPLSYNNMQPSLAITEGLVTSGIFPPHDGGQGTPDYIGSIRLFAFNFAPGGTTATHGQLMSISGNTAVFSLLGTTYGGNGSTNFALPNLDGRISVDAGQSPGLANHVLGEAYGLPNTSLLRLRKAITILK